jgi:hypothetical protein
MIEKQITAKIDQVIKTGLLEEDQVKEIHKLEVMFPEDPKVVEVMFPENPEVVKEEPQKVEEPEEQ